MKHLCLLKNTCFTKAAFPRNTSLCFFHWPAVPYSWQTFRFGCQRFQALQRDVSSAIISAELLLARCVGLRCDYDRVMLGPRDGDYTSSVTWVHWDVKHVSDQSDWNIHSARPPHKAWALASCGNDRARLQVLVGYALGLHCHRVMSHVCVAASLSLFYIKHFHTVM